MKTELLGTRTVPERDAAVDAAVRLLRAGEVVGLPTETVYGLAADATNADAVVKIFEAKERPFFNPLIVHLPARPWLYRVAACDDMLVLVEELTAAFWPGPLTLVLPRWKHVPDIVTAGLKTVAVRMSSHPIFQQVCGAFGKPLAAPSANRFGRISPTTAAAVVSELGGRIPLVVDGGHTEHGLESTIVAVEPGRLRLLRSGPIAIDELETIAPVEVSAAGKTPEAPGQLKNHYAPRTPLRLLANEGGEFGPPVLPPGTGLLAFRARLPQHAAAEVEILSATGDLREAAATLFSKLRRLDEAGLNVILAEPVPETGLGVAIMDRLRKAAGES
jgi:L-threonylcarbamoyladenylate synthase